MASETWLLLFASALAAVALARSGAASCQCEAGDYWCSSDGFMRYTYNCSGSDRAKALWKKIGGEEYPREEDCQALSTVCEGFAGAHSRSAANQTCDDECYEYCWKKDVGDCADMDDQQMFCVGQCMSYCSVTKCRAKAHEWSSCQADCNSKYMEGKEVNFIDYSNCMSKCTLVPIFPHDSEDAHPTPKQMVYDPDACACDDQSYWCANANLPYYAYNCSGSNASIALRNRIHGVQGHPPSQEDCDSLKSVCDVATGAYGNHSANNSCETTCNHNCWNSPSECSAAAARDYQYVCYGICMDYCIGKQCTTPPKQWSDDCQTKCQDNSPPYKGNDPSNSPKQFEYARCMVNCTKVPYAPPALAPPPSHGKLFVV